MLLLALVEPVPTGFAAGLAATVAGNGPELPAGRATSVEGVSVFENDLVTSGAQNQIPTTDSTASKAAFFGLAATSRRSFRRNPELTRTPFSAVGAGYRPLRPVYYRPNAGLT